MSPTTVQLPAHYPGIKYAAGIALLLTLMLNWVPFLDVQAADYLAISLTDNLLIYASARGINALISVIQSIEVSVSLGAGVAVHFGEILDPLNDLVERFSGFVLYSLAALGLQQIILTATTSIFAKVLVTIALIGTYLAWLGGRKLPDWFKRLLGLIILVRFVLVLEVGVCWTLDTVYFDQHQQQALSTLDLARDQLQQVRERYDEAIKSKGILSGLWDAAKSIIDVDELQSITELTAVAIVQLIVIMLIRSVLLPLGFLWLTFYCLRRFFD